jgi:hypothetical protein
MGLLIMSVLPFPKFDASADCSLLGNSFGVLNPAPGHRPVNGQNSNVLPDFLFNVPSA